MISVASIPAAHPYVRSITPSDARVAILGDPRPIDAITDTQWWPPRYLEPEYLRANLDRIDLVHVHFGFDAATPARLADVVDVLRTSRTPLVLTVHDLHNPHFADAAQHRAQLDVLIPAADAILTLTDGAAHEIERRWGRSAQVVPHPHVAPLELIAAREPRDARSVVAVHAKSLRANLDPEAILPTVIDTAASLGAVVRIDIDDDIFDHTSHWYAPEIGERLVGLHDLPDVDVRVHRHFTDDELWQYLSEIDVAVLPYRFGTHSGWMEACRDFGVAPVVPDNGHFSDQFPCETFTFGPSLFDAPSLRRAITDAVASEPGDGATFADFRRHQRDTAAADHADLYLRLAVRAVLA